MGYSDNRGKNRGRKTSSGSGGSRDGRGRRSGGYGGYRPSYGGGGGGGSGGSRFAPADAPVEVGKEYTVTIGELSRRGEGVAKVSGFVIFVPGAKADAEAKVKIKIERVSARFANASLVEGGSVVTEESSNESTEEQEEMDSSSSQSDSDSMVEQV